MRRAVLVFTVLSLLAAASVQAGPNTVQLQSLGWSAPVPLSAVSAGIVDVSLAVSEGGTVHVIWDDGGRLFHAFGAPVAGSPASEIAYGESPALTGGQGSAAHLAFGAPAGSRNDVYASDWTGSAWSLPVGVLPTEGESSAPAIDRLGDQLAIAWAEATDLGDIYLATREGGGSWVGGAALGAAGGAPDVCLDAAGVHVLFQDRDPLTGKTDLWYALRNGRGWSLPVSVSNSPDWNSYAGRLACLAGQVHAIWQQATVSGYQIQHATGSGSGWGAATAVSAMGDAFSPDLAASGSTLHLAWAQTGVVAYRRWSGGNWGTVETMGVSGYALDVAVGAAPDGTVHLAWVELGAGGTARVMYAWRAAAEPTSTPTRTSTATITRTPTATSTWTATATQTRTLTASPSATATPTRALTASPTATRTPAVMRRIYLPVVLRGMP